VPLHGREGLDLPAEVGFLDAGVFDEVGAGTVERNPADLEHIGPVADFKRHPGVLLDQQACTDHPLPRLASGRHSVKASRVVGCGVSRAGIDLEATRLPVGACASPELQPCGGGAGAIRWLMAQVPRILWVALDGSATVFRRSYR
jgi:hypothetical protein